MPFSSVDLDESISCVLEQAGKWQIQSFPPGWEKLFEEDPYKSNEDCGDLARRYGWKISSTLDYWAQSRKDALRKFIISENPFILPPALRILCQGYARLGKKLNTYRQAEELSQKSMICPYDIQNFFALHRQLDREWRASEATPNGEDCPRLFISRPAMRNEYLKRNATFIFDVKRIWRVDEEPHPVEYDDPVGPPWYNQRSRCWLDRRRHQQFGSGSWFKETPLPFSNNYDWKTWTQQELLEFLSQFLTKEALYKFRVSPIRPADLEMFDSSNSKLSDLYKVSKEEVIQMKTFLAEMTAFQLAAERATEAIDAMTMDQN